MKKINSTLPDWFDGEVYEEGGVEFLKIEEND